jgi:hypothetical protein
MFKLVVDFGAALREDPEKDEGDHAAAPLAKRTNAPESFMLRNSN